MLLYNSIAQVNVPILTDGQLYIYVLENAPQGNIKIGKSTNMQQRLRALSGSNSGGNYITRIAVSDATYLYTLEQISHHHFDDFRIQGTEWFDGTYMSFEDAVEYVDSLFSSKEYQVCNGVRQQFVMRYGDSFKH